ncbi:MAG: hypothetical protein A2144_08730 [Chloroflexi bacterium RBG_16_50_9]|nr:MAG: hypothetical protein A2144_08730 [Chloroflexi bacterium RBG_16_50_9]
MKNGQRMHLAFRVSATKLSGKAKAAIKVNSAAMKKYAARYQAYLNEIKTSLENMFDRWRKEKLSVCIFGAGTHTQFFLNILNLRENDIVCIVDSDPAKHGKVIAGSKFKILPPSAINEMHIDVVLVSSASLQDELIDQLHNMGVRSRIVKIYPRPEYL